MESEAGAFLIIDKSRLLLLELLLARVHEGVKVGEILVGRVRLSHLVILVVTKELLLVLEFVG